MSLLFRNRKCSVPVALLPRALRRPSSGENCYEFGQFVSGNILACWQTNIYNGCTETRGIVHQCAARKTKRKA